MLYVTDVEQALQSDAVVVATIGQAVISPHPTYNTVMTETSIQIDEIITGNAPTPLTIRQIGGTINGKTLYVPGDARFKNGEKVVLFLNSHDGIWYLTAMEQSKYNLQKHPRFGWIMTRDLHEGLLTKASSGGLVPYKPITNKPFLSLTDFKKKLQRGGVK